MDLEYLPCCSLLCTKTVNVDPSPAPHKLSLLRCTHSQALKFAMRGTKDGPNSWLGSCLGRGQEHLQEVQGRERLIRSRNQSEG